MYMFVIFFKWLYTVDMLVYIYATSGAAVAQLVVDTSCPSGSCKLLCAWTKMLPPSQRSCAGA